MSQQLPSKQRPRISWTTEFDRRFAEFEKNMQTLLDSQRILDQNVSLFLSQVKQIVSTRNRFVSYGILFAMICSIASVLISILK